jgi:hypothetical protein
LGTCAHLGATVMHPHHHSQVMMGCHFQDRPCKASLCLIGLLNGDDRAHYLRCDGPTEAACPHRAWDHGTHLEVCRRRDEVIGRCTGCGGRHDTMLDALRCRLAISVRMSFSDEEPRTLGPEVEEIPSLLRMIAWRMIRRGVIERDGKRCRLCGKDLSSVPSWLTEVHHVQPKSDGGSDHPSNLMTLCVMCHRRITAEAVLEDEGGRRPTLWDDALPLESLDAFR